MATLLPGVRAHRVPTARLTVNVLDVGRDTGDPVVFVHGNVSSAMFWQTTLLGLPERFRPIAVDLRGFGETDPWPVDSTAGLGDFAADVAATLDALQTGPVHLVGWSMGGGVVMRLLLTRPELVRSLTLVAPVSPYGFGGTTGPDGQLTSRDGAGSGAGAANSDFVRLLAAGQDGIEEAASPRAVLRAFYVAPGLVVEHEDLYVESMLTTRTGDHHYPGDTRTSESWPGVAPGASGVLNAMAPTFCNLAAITDVDPKPPVLWIRGDADLIVSDASMFDLATLGQLGYLPDWPGAPTHSPQPMLEQTRAVLDRYADGGGDYREVVLPGVGHSPPLEAPEAFRAALVELFDRSAQA